jgi:cytochrome c
MRIFLFFFIITFISSCSQKENKPSRPHDPWAFRSVLDRHPRMLTLALDTACYAAYDLAHCRLYKVWKGGVMIEGAAYTDKKNIQPTSWGTAYSDDLENKWSVSRNSLPDSFRIINKGYRFEKGQIILHHNIITSTNDTIKITELPEFIHDKNNQPSFERTFTTYNVPGGISITLSSASNNFQLPVNSTAVLVNHFTSLPQQAPVASEGEYDHRGRYWMEKSDCFTCHEIDKKTVGPSLQEIAGKYGDQENPSIALFPR